MTYPYADTSSREGTRKAAEAYHGIYVRMEECGRGNSSRGGTPTPWKKTRKTQYKA